MSEYIIQKETLDELANVINDKTGDSEAMTPAEMAEKIREELFKPSGTKRITVNGLADVRGYASADIDVPSDSPVIRPLSVSQNGVYTAPGSIDGYSPVTVGVMTGVGERATPGVYFLDLEGEVVETWPAAEVAGKTALPAIPVHERLIGQEWSWQLQTIKDYFVSYPNAAAYMRPVYKTASGLTEADITLTKMTGKTVTFNMVGTKDWGDGSSDSLTTHTYANYGDYTIKCDGTALPAGNPGQYGSGGGLFQSTTVNVNRWLCTALFVGENVTTINEHSCYCCYSLRTLTIPVGGIILKTGAFGDCVGLVNVSLPRGVTWSGKGVFSGCLGLLNVTLPPTTNTLETLFASCYSLRYVTAPGNLVEVSSGMFKHCYNLREITLPNTVTEIQAEAFYGCYSLRYINIPTGVTEIGNEAFDFCYSLQMPELHDGLTSIGVKAFQHCYRFVGKIVMPKNISKIGWGAFGYLYNVTEYDFSRCSAVPTLQNSDDTGAFHYINGLCKIVVPAQLYDEWIADSTWSQYVNYVYPAGVLRYTKAVNSGGEIQTLTTNISCKVGDLLVAAFRVRDSSYTISDGWTLLGISPGVVYSADLTQYTGLAYKYAESTSESITITQGIVQSIQTNIVAITGATGITYNGFTTQETGPSITAERPDGLVVWGVSSILWKSNTPYGKWSISESEIAAIQDLTVQPRLLLALDQGTHDSVTFAYPQTGDAKLACGSCTITGIPNFWYVEEE